MASKFSYRVTTKEKALAEHYVYGILASGLAVHQISPHDSFKVLATKALVAGLVVPVLARLNPKSLVNQIDNITGAPESLTAPIVNAVIADANKVVATTEATK